MAYLTDRIKQLSGALQTASLGENWRQAALFIALALTMGVAGIVSPSFLTVDNVSNVLRQSAALGIVSLGQSMVMIAGGFDLSVTATMQLATVMVAEISKGRDERLPLAFGLALLMGLIIGTFNGVVTAKRRSSAFMVTLAVSLAVTGARLLYTGATPSGLLPNSLRPLSQGQVFGIPFSLVLLLTLTLIASIVLRKTTFGRKLYAAGANPQAAHLSGVNVERIWIITFMISGVLAALAGLVLAAYIGYVDQWLGGGYDLDSIAAAAIGGVSLAGGAGGVWGTLAGVLLIRMLMNFVLVLQLPVEYQLVVRGAVVILVVALYAATAKRRS